MRVNYFSGLLGQAILALVVSKSHRVSAMPLETLAPQCQSDCLAPIANEYTIEGSEDLA